MTMTLSKVGDWHKAGMVLNSINKNMIPAYEARIMENGELILKTMQGHIDKQDLDWTPLSEHTIALKKGDDTIYVETGYLRDNIGVRRVKSSKNNMTLFVGASAWKKTPSGVKFSDLMIWLEYGTSKMPARPLVRPTWEEVQDTIKNGWVELLGDFISSGGSKV